MLRRSSAPEEKISLEDWNGLFRPGERVRLRFINASPMTVFNVRFRDLPMAVVAADRNGVRPVKVDEFESSVGARPSRPGSA